MTADSAGITRMGGWNMSSTDKKPRLLVFAGPNGSGKSTVTSAQKIVGEYVNADRIKQIKGCSDLEAAQEAERLREYLLEHRMDFSFETVLSTPRNLLLIHRSAGVYEPLRTLRNTHRSPCNEHVCTVWLSSAAYPDC